jgi:DNA transformation protein
MDRAEIEEIFAPFGSVQVRAMFGGYGVSREGASFAIVADGEVFLKADDASRAQFAAAGSTPFVYQAKGKPVTMSYWRIPEIALDDPDEMRRWCGLAHDAARRAVARLPRRTGRARR